MKIGRPRVPITADPGGAGSAVARHFATAIAVVYLFAAAISFTYWSPRPGIRQPFWPEGFFGLLNVPMSESVFIGLLLFTLTGALLRHKRFAFIIALLFQLLGVVRAALTWAHLAMPDVLSRWVPHVVSATGHHTPLWVTFVGGIVGVVVSIALWRYRGVFAARRSPEAQGRTAAVLAVGLTISFLVALLAPVSAGSHAHPGHTRVLFALRAAFGLSESGGPYRDWIADLSGAISAITLLIAAVILLRSRRTTRTITPAVERTIRRLLLTGEPDSLGYFATRRDKAAVFSADGRAAVTYRVIASVSLASADPIGPRDAWEDAIAAWLREAHTYGWVPGVLSASEQGAEAYAAAGLSVIPLGDEAIIDTAEFRLGAPELKPVRQAVRRLERLGYTTSIRRHGEIPGDELARLEALADEWRGNATERGFSMALSRLGDRSDSSCVMVLAHDGAGAVVGMLSFVPWSRTGLSLDLMRRQRDDVNGIIEFMITALIDYAKDQRIRRISLNFAMFRRVFADAERFDAGLLDRFNNAVLSLFSRFYQLESLYRSNAKYLPRWVPRYVCLDSPLSLPRFAIAAGVAEGFLPDPAAKRLQSHPRPDGFTEAIQADEATYATVAIRDRRLSVRQRQRRAQLDRVRAEMPAYPVAVPRTDQLSAALTAAAGTALSITGRVLRVRDHGSLVFADITEDGATVQLLLEASRVPTDRFTLWRATVRRGDIVSATGVLGASRTGERSLLVDDWAMAAKALEPLPGAVADAETRLRRRSVDMILHPDVQRALAARGAVLRSVRDTLNRAGYTEVETPILQAVHGGASARPFRTHINAYGMDLSLRIAPELFLKRLVIGGSGPIFEIGRNFRNEGVDASHNPEFTALEAYLPYGDYDRMRELTQDLIRAAAIAVHGEPVAVRDGKRIDLRGDWPLVRVHDAVSRACGRQITPDTPTAEVAAIATELGIAIPTGASAGEIVAKLYDERVEGATWAPVFYTDFPVETSPLTRTHRTDPRLAERWDLVAFGMEIGTAYSELTDPVDQRARLTRQSVLAAAGDPEAMELDEEFLAAMEVGMPPTGGLGIGIDRLVMMVTGSSIRSVLSFPFVRPRNSGIPDQDT